MTIVPHQAACVLFFGLAVPMAMRLLGMHSDAALYQLPKHCRQGNVAMQRLRCCPGAAQQVLAAQ